MRAAARGGIALAAAAAIVAADLLWLPARLQAWLLPAGGPTAADMPRIETWFTLGIFGVLIVAGLAGGAIERRNAAAMGDAPARWAGIGIVAGAGGISLAALYALLAGTLVRTGAPASAASLVLWGMAVVLVQAGGEEVFFRGWLQPLLVGSWGRAAGLGATTILFAGAHALAGALSAVALVNLALGGAIFGLFALSGRGLAGAVAMHWGWNAGEQMLWGLDPNPGLGGFGAIADRDLIGRAWWGGSPEGLNGSIAMTVVLLAILIPLAARAWQAGDARKPVPRPA